MPDPRKTIAAQQAVQQVLRLAGGHQHGQADQRERATHKVQAPAGAVAVLAEVEGIELGKAREAARVGAWRVGRRGILGGGAGGHRCLLGVEYTACPPALRRGGRLWVLYTPLRAAAQSPWQRGAQGVPAAWHCRSATTVRPRTLRSMA